MSFLNWDINKGDYEADNSDYIPKRDVILKQEKIQSFLIKCMTSLGLIGLFYIMLHLMSTIDL